MDNFGRIFDFEERELAWAIIILFEKGILSSISMDPAIDLPTMTYSSIIPALKTVKENRVAFVDDALDARGDKVQSSYPDIILVT